MTGEVRPKGGSGFTSTSSLHSEVREDFLISISSSPCAKAVRCNGTP